MPWRNIIVDVPLSLKERCGSSSCEESGFCVGSLSLRDIEVFVGSGCLTLLVCQTIVESIKDPLTDQHSSTGGSTLRSLAARKLRNKVQST